MVGYLLFCFLSLLPAGFVCWFVGLFIGCCDRFGFAWFACVWLLVLPLGLGGLGAVWVVL